MLEFWLDSGDYFFFIFGEVEPFDELFPVNEFIGFIIAVHEQQIQLFGGKGYI
jgi:hypothetical protein